MVHYLHNMKAFVLLNASREIEDGWLSPSTDEEERKGKKREDLHKES